MNGSFLKWVGALGALGILVGMGVWVGATDYRGEETRRLISQHTEQPAHFNAASRISTLEERYRSIKEDITEIKELVKENNRKVDRIYFRENKK